MAYAPTNWVDNVTPVDAARMNNIEAGISALGEGIQYENVYAPATPYQAGDVVTYNGVQYLAVNPSTGVTPPTVTPAGYVQQDAVTVAGTRLVSTKLLAADAQPAFRIMGDGKHEWGPGGSTVPDTQFYRAAAGLLRADATALDVRRAFASDSAYAALITGDTAYRFQAQADGKLTWGPGNAAADANLYRQAAGTLKADGVLLVGSYAYAMHGMSSQIAFLDTNSNPTMWFGSAFDTNLYRNAADQLATDDALRFKRTALLNTLEFHVGAEPQLRFNARMDGMLSWGDGASSVDTNLFRSGAGVLRTDGNFHVGGALFLTSQWITTQPDGKARFLGLANAATYIKGGGAATAVSVVMRASDDTDVLSLDKPATDLWTSLSIATFTTAGGVVQKRVVIGAPDSGGSGYRMLRVLN